MNATGSGKAQGPEALRKRADEFVGMFFYGTLLKGVREHRLTNSKLGFGGRGEEAFGAQLDQELAQRAGKATHTGLTDAIVRQLAAKMPGQGETGLPAAGQPAATLPPDSGGLARATAVRGAYQRPGLKAAGLDVTH